MDSRTIGIIFGTRPEAIKMIPIIRTLQKQPDKFDVKVIVTGQHREMLHQVLKRFDVVPDIDLDIMEKNQTPISITNNILNKLGEYLENVPLDMVLVHGDTTTTFAAALSAYYRQVAIGHVEAGLRTWNKYSPFPEEMNRRLTDCMVDLYFAPTEQSKRNLIKENHPESAITVTGNTGIDMLRYTLTLPDPQILQLDKKRILLTIHRRESLGEPMVKVFRAIRRILIENPEVEVIFPMHLNPKVRELAQEELAGCPNGSLIEPLDVVEFHHLMKASTFIVTDSGGIQEEAPYLKKPVLVVREETERPEGVESGILKVIGYQEEDVYREIKKLLEDPEYYELMSQSANPYGDGRASERIAKNIWLYFQKKEYDKEKEVE